VYKQLPLAITPNLDSQFENFYCSKKNQTLILALQQFLSGTKDTVFYLWGPRFSGITHLLEACLNQNSHSAIQYFPLAELIQYPAEDLLEGLEEMKFVLVDNLEAVAGHQQWQEALFHLHNRLQSKGNHLILGSHCAPRELPIQLADLKSRLLGGDVFALQELTEDEKQKAIQFTAEKLGLTISDDLAFFLFQRVGRSTEDLFAIVKTLDEASLAEQRKLTIPFVKQVLNL
jgi:DnaA family protein